MTRGANRSPKFWNSEIVLIPIRYSDGQQLIFSDNHSYLVTFSATFDKFNVVCVKKTLQLNICMKHQKMLGSIYSKYTTLYVFVSIKIIFWQFSRKIMFSETFRNIPKVSETLGYRSLDYIILTCCFGPVMSF